MTNDDVPREFFQEIACHIIKIAKEFHTVSLTCIFRLSAS